MFPCEFCEIFQNICERLLLNWTLLLKCQEKLIFRGKNPRRFSSTTSFNDKTDPLNFSKADSHVAEDFAKLNFSPCSKKFYKMWNPVIYRGGFRFLKNHTTGESQISSKNREGVIHIRWLLYKLTIMWPNKKAFALKLRIHTPALTEFFKVFSRVIIGYGRLNEPSVYFFKN